MKLIKSLILFAFVASFSLVSAQTEDYYGTAIPNSKKSNYLFYKPDSGFAAIKKYDKQIQAGDIKPVLVNYGERIDLYSGENYTIETDRSNALYFKANNGKREIFLKTYLSDAKCWGNGAVVYITPNSTDKNLLDVFVQSTIKANTACDEPILQINIETTLADATGKQPATFIEKVAEQISVVDDKKALLVMLPREHLTKLVSVNFWLYNKSGKEVKEFINMRAAENIVYINDLPKGKYTYKIEVYDGTLIKKGEVILKK